MTSVRLATIDDVPQIVKLGAIMHAESPRFSRFKYVPDKVATIARTMIELPHNIVIVAEQRGVGVIGLFAGFVAEHYFSTDKFASDAAVFIAPAFRGGSAYPRMLKMFEEWAIMKGAVEIAPGISTEVRAERTLELYQKLGYRLSGFMTVKYVQP